MMSKYSNRIRWVSFVHVHKTPAWVEIVSMGPMNSLHNTHQSTPFLNIIHSINPNTKVPCECKDLNPMQQMLCEELFNCFLHFLDTRAAGRNLQKVLCPKITCIFQTISNVVLPATREILDLTENSIVIKVADIPLQPFPHKPEA